MNNTFIIYDTNPSEPPRTARIFRDPAEMICCRDEKEIPACFERLEKGLSGGYHAAGFLSYELGLYFQEIAFSRKSDFPLFCFGIFPSCETVSLDELDSVLEPDKRGFNITNGSYSVPYEAYRNDIQHIKKHIKSGNTYQVNYTFKYKFDFDGSPAALFNHLRKKQEVPYAAFLDLERWSILSLSPELFFRKDKDHMLVRPMKGTIDRGKNNEEDAVNMDWLARSNKNRAENIMIVDLLRNDLGIISKTGTVRVDKLFDVEKYRTVFQMTSTVHSLVRESVSWPDIFRSVFPSGSVTGAPKKRTMEIILETEKEERDIYTGSIGYISPGGKALFNVAIRTLLLDKTRKKGDMGIGSGIVYDSQAEKEYNESELKGYFLTNPDFAPGFDLIETLLWENGSYFLLDLHLERLGMSAKYFSYPYDEENIKHVLEKLSEDFDPQRSYRVRFLLKRSGKTEVEFDVIEKTGEVPAKIAVSGKRTDRKNIFFHHKTTNRSLYDSELDNFRKKGFFDVIFLNREGEVTEGAITNIVICNGNDYYTPPVSSGLLGGVYRKYLLKEKKLPIKEKVLFLEDIENADEVYLINSVRKMVPAVLRR